jgi:hypothetical protein
MKNKLKRIGVLLLALLFCGLFTACGGADSPEKAAVGTYVGEQYWFAGEPENKLDNSGFTIELASGGKSTVTRDNLTLDGTWTLDGETITITETLFGLENVYTGTLVNGKLTITSGDPSDIWSVTYTFSKQ